MTYTPGLFIHIVGGITAVFAGYWALFARKGSRVHRLTGRAFVYSMLFMASGGAYIALTKGQKFNVLAGMITIYLVSTAMLTVTRKAGTTGRVDAGFLALALITAALALFFAATTTKGPVGPYYVFATIALLLASSDVRMLVRGGVYGAERISRHLWRMCFALFVASGSFFLGTASDPVLKKSGLRATLFTKDIRATHLPEVPVLILAALTVYWLIRVRVSKQYKTNQPPQSRGEQPGLAA